MGNKQITMVDIGVGNLLNVKRAFEFCGTDVKIATTSKDIKQADRLVLPGVGAFGACISKMKEAGLDEAVIAHVQAERPLFGICVGMQLLFSHSEEFGTHAGLGLIEGHVGPIACVTTDQQPLKVPHIGWSHLLTPETGRSWEGSFLAPFEGQSPAFYFVHSFVATNVAPQAKLADVVYGNHRLCIAVQHDNIMATQFHPERSGPSGLGVIESYLTL